MNLHDNTILITGGGTGIGRALAEKLHYYGNQVIVAGRRENVLRDLCAANPGMEYFVLDVADAASVAGVGAKAAQEFPRLNCVVNSAGVQSRGVKFGAENGASSFNDAAMFSEIQTNLSGTIRMCAAFIPQLKGKAGATIINVSSGLAFVPLAWIPIYCATKAAVHSFTLSLRRQLRDESIRVQELIPPYVKTDLGGMQTQPVNFRPSMQPMPLADFTERAVEGLVGDLDEVIVGGAAGLAAAGGLESAKTLFARMNP
ncbi:MAG TPA: SDR family NAD(P)-dependent oxidoreductase [Candidatus Aquilonibacter sp.]|nr:SDR family NAD(P)-dependent oxidoreductase [Candidatus Aquilonibacter sp.]